MKDPEKDNLGLRRVMLGLTLDKRVLQKTR